ncbi:MAG: molybdopterin dinucleotide binding domain-containing protein [Methanofollis liminatans]|jgi:formylmethanofuran dehydrogenase subunit D|uniref:Molybdopterin dinucleotide-binding region n=1 Tax=Methanofollis liminatans DSM 4140 TaxID=28892 RepID=J0S8N5_9EURY|nr:molybdopterin dinucleotide binding domain-containing protein [Methanofollis liminatans]EJG06959.1 molybdopterin dinucleotide-binding region [Methanofollis liminatans DSM 4140]MDD3110769.1 molybdopterin dinucleotide binding domain-containing protein [Methanofollis liminatans]
MTFLFNTGRTSAQGTGLEHKSGPEYREATSVCRMNPVDLMQLEIEAGERIRAAGPGGVVVLRVAASDDIPQGTVFVPLGPYANAVVGGETHGTGMPDYKSVEVEIEPTDDPVPTIDQLMEAVGGLAYLEEER